MNRPARTLLLLAAAAFASMAPPASGAVAQRTFVASNGNDNNACSLVAPCRSFAGAIAKTNAGGEVIVLDSAGYGPVTIAQSVSIIAPAGVYAGVSVFSGNGVTITTPGITVTLRGLSINGQGGDNGIFYVPGAASPSMLHVESCTIAGLSASGIYAAFGEIAISDTVVRDNAGTGIFLAFHATATLERVRSEHNGSTVAYAGIYVTGGAEAMVSDSVVTSSLSQAIQVQNAGKLTVARSTITSIGSHGIQGDAPYSGQSVIINVESSAIVGQTRCVYATASTGAYVEVGIARSTLASPTIVIEANSDLGGSINGTITSNRIATGFFDAVYATGVGSRLLVTKNAMDRASSLAPAAGIDAWNGALIVAGGNDIDSNAGLQTKTGGTIQSRGDNTVAGTITGNVVAIGGH